MAILAVNPRKALFLCRTHHTSDPHRMCLSTLLQSFSTFHSVLIWWVTEVFHSFIDFCRRRCVLEGGTLSYFEGERTIQPSGRIYMRDVCCLSVTRPGSLNQHGFEFTMELCCVGESERVYLFGTNKEDVFREWTLKLAQVRLPKQNINLLSAEMDYLSYPCYIVQFALKVHISSSYCTHNPLTNNLCSSGPCGEASASYSTQSH
uniref:PH domain-containing protein n=1 Tax=Eptatretus burgeri TaxID=7764 RepID=A0A8C4QWN8_EPTBU